MRKNSRVEKTSEPVLVCHKMLLDGPCRLLVEIITLCTNWPDGKPTTLTQVSGWWKRTWSRTMLRHQESWSFELDLSKETTLGVWAFRWQFDKPPPKLFQSFQCEQCSSVHGRHASTVSERFFLDSRDHQSKVTPLHKSVLMVLLFPCSDLFTLQVVFTLKEGLKRWQRTDH